ncbi:HD domain-containing protein [Lacrimispora sp. JR3]|uniref:HD domain-containing protein n=1 Tax=Lacrimispora sinapis TaxID=3111456 RepID=UPI0037496E19
MEKEEWAVLCTLYIEEHLKEELSVKRLSEWAGYSPWYFSRCFKEKVGASPMEYLKQRRLLAAAREIRRGRRILDAAMDYGWETHGGFTKAFVSQFGYSPVYLRAFHFRDVSMKGEIMELSLKNMEFYKEPEELFSELCRTLTENGTEYHPEELRSIYEAASNAHKGQTRYSGEAYVTHPLNVAIILADMGADIETVCAGLLHDLLFNAFFQDKKNGCYFEHQEEMKAVLQSYQEFNQTGTCTDDRGALVALADRLHNMRTIEFVDPSTWKQRAEETLKVFSPLAAKYQDLRLRSELDDLSIKHLII